MYAVYSEVLTLCANVRTGLDQPFVEVQARLVDDYIDAALAENFAWPNDASGTTITPVPSMVVSIANYMTAGQCETVKFAQNEASGQNEGNPYGARLYKIGENMLKRLMSGDLVLPELVENNPVRQSSSPAAFFPVGGGRGPIPFGGGVRSRRG